MNYLSIKNLYLTFVFILLCFVSEAQQQDRRTLQTRVADVLAKFPAADSKEYEKLMNEMAALGKEGIAEMAGRINPPGKGDNTKIFYALNGLSFYANSGNREELRKTTSNALIQALEKSQDPFVKAFIISQLQLVGKEEAVSPLQKYLVDSNLCDPAARALVKINSPSAHQTLLKGLSESQGNCQYAILDALGEIRFKEAKDELTKQITNKDPKAQKLALFALANIGDPSSETVLAKEAQKAGYILSDNNAMASYLLWAKRMVEAGNTKPVEKLAQNLVKQLKNDNQVHSRIAALKLLVDIKGSEANPILVTAANDKNTEYLGAALRFATNLKGDNITKQWIDQYKKASPEAKSAILNMLSNRNDPAALVVVNQALDSKEPSIQLAAIKAAPKLGGEQAIPKLLELVKTADAEQAEAIKTSLLNIKNEDMDSRFEEVLKGSNSYGKAALLEVIGRRKAEDYAHLPLKYANEQDSLVRTAALNSLQQVSKEENLADLYVILSKANTDAEANAIQQAISVALGNQQQNEKTNIILNQIFKIAPDEKHFYYNILADIGGKKAMETVLNEYENGSIKEKKAAIDALSKWSDFAGRELLQIAKSTKEELIAEQALNGYVRQIRLHDNTPMNKYLLLREGMEISKTPEQKKMMLQEIGRNPSFPALMYAGKFLDDNQLKDAAVHAVMNIATSSKEYNGKEVKEMLQKVIDGLVGQESAYLKEAVQKHLDELPDEEGFQLMFNGKDLQGWKGFVADPVKLSKMKAKKLQREQKKADEEMGKSWIVEDGKLVFTGHGENIVSEKDYGDFEMYVDWKIEPEGDAGIYLRGTPQVQIWDTTRRDVGAEVGSGGLYNNKKHSSKPSKVADNPVGEWNTFRIKMEGERVSVFLNGEEVVDSVVMENYWDPNQPIFPTGPIELQAHGTKVYYRDIYIKELNKTHNSSLNSEEDKEGYKVLFDGTNLDHFTGATNEYEIENGVLLIRKDKKGNLFTKDQYSDFILRFEFKLTPGANNGLAIRSPLEGDPAYTGMEIQILDNNADIYKNLEPYQYHGSVYGIIPAEKGYLKPVGEWNYQEVQVQGPNIRVILNGSVILHGNLEHALKDGAFDGLDHPGAERKTGHIGFLGHESEVRFRNIRIKELGK